MENVKGFFGILAEWSRAENPAPENDREKARHPCGGGGAMKGEGIADRLGGRKIGDGCMARCPIMMIARRTLRSASQTTTMCRSICHAGRHQRRPAFAVRLSDTGRTMNQVGLRRPSP